MATGAPPTSPASAKRRPRTLYSGPAASVAGALRIGGHHRWRDRRGRRHVDERRSRPRRPAADVVRDGCVARDRAARDRRACRRRRRRFDAARTQAARSRGRPTERAHRRTAVRLLRRPGSARRRTGATIVSPRDGDDADHFVLRLADGTARRRDRDVCRQRARDHRTPATTRGHRHRTRRVVDALESSAPTCGLDGRQVAERMMTAASDAVCELVYRPRHDAEAARTRDRRRRRCGRRARSTTSRHGWACRARCRAGAEIISSIGDALSMVRAERERTVHTLTAEIVRQLSDEAENEALDRRCRAGNRRGSRRGAARTGNGAGDRHRHRRAAQWRSLPARSSSPPSTIAARRTATTPRSRTPGRSGSSHTRHRSRHRRPLRRSGRHGQGRALHGRRSRCHGRAAHPLPGSRHACGRRSGSSARARIAELSSSDMIEAATALHDPDDPSGSILIVGRKT